jgi:hypothetical protein
LIHGIREAAVPNEVSSRSRVPAFYRSVEGELDPVD